MKKTLKNSNKSGLSRAKSSGFTLIETLVAIVVLVTVVVGTMTAVQGGISSYIFSKNQIIAFYLAQEGFEQIRNIRDENRTKDANWLSGIAAVSSDPCYFGKICNVDPAASPGNPYIVSCTDTCNNLRQDPVTGLYRYNSSWPETVFRRQITLTSINANEVSITVTVDWSKGVVTRQFKARENLFNW